MKHMKKLITMALLAVSVLAISIPAMASYSTKYVNCPIGETVRLRNGPSTSSTILANVPRGTALEAEYYNSSWYRIRNYTHSNGTTYNGYMMSSFLSSTNPNASTPWIERYGSATLRPSNTYNWYVEVMQEDLIDLGYDLSPYGADGYFGNKTTIAVKSFQSSHGLDADGYVGNQTKSVLYTAYMNSGH